MATSKAAARLTPTGRVRVFRVMEGSLAFERSRRMWQIVERLRAGEVVEVTMAELDDVLHATGNNLDHGFRVEHA